MERCPYCFKPLPEGGECSCHYEESRNARIEEALRPGSIVGACYQIGAVLGQGGFGITYRGYDLDMQKIVAIKEFYPKGLVVRFGTVSEKAVSDGKSKFVRTVNTEGKEVFRKSLDLFYREAIALGRLDKQPNVVHAYRIFRENGTAYIVMEFVEGQSLKGMVNERGRIPEDELLPLLEPVLTALDKVHNEGILHRDIAPDNIMIENGVPILLDFGAARVEEGHHSSLVIGKKGYSSYEQIAGGAQDRRSDIYAIGATYYTALSGIIPQDAAMRGLKDEVVPLKDLGFGISEKTSDAVARAMAINPDDRWNTAAEFRDALKGNPDNENREPVYQAAVQLMKTGTGEGYTGALRLFEQIPGYKDSKILAKESGRKAAELQEQTRQTGKKQTNQETPVPPKTGIPPKKNKILPFILAAAAVLGIAVFLMLRSCSRPDDLTDQEMTLTALASYREQSTAIAYKTETQQVIDAELTAIAGDVAAKTAIYHETETKQAEPTETPVPPTDTPEPTATDTPIPTATDTPEPTATDTPVPTATDTPVPTATGTPVPTATDTPVPTATDTPMPTATDTMTPTAADPEDLARMGEDAYQNGEYEKALEYLVPATELGNPDAPYRLALMYENGLGVEQSDEKMEEYYLLAADRGNVYAQYFLGLKYDLGSHVEQSHEKSAEYLQMAADQGYVYAQYDLGKMYYSGQGVEQSYETAAAYYQLAADQDYDIAQYELGKMYEDGIGVPQSYDNALKYYQLASGHGHKGAMERIETLTVMLTKTAEPTAMPPAETPAAADADPAYLAEQGENAYGSGKYDLALEYLIPAAEAGNAAAQFRIGTMYENGKGTERSYETAAGYYQMAADQGHANAQHNLAHMYEIGRGVEQSYETAREYYQMAADQGYAASQINLGSMYESGKGVEQSYKTAQEYYQMAADLGHPIADNALQRITGLLLAELQPGDIIHFGYYEQNEKEGADLIQWQVLAIEDGRALVISRYGLEAGSYNSSYGDITWEESDLRAWLNGTFRDSAFTPHEKAMISETLNSNPDNPEYGTAGGNDTMDKVFLLSIDEVQKYLETDASRQCEATFCAKQNGAAFNSDNGYSWWWLRSSGNNGKTAAGVNSYGALFINGNNTMNNYNLIRPAFWLDLPE